jgi:hypothetical protein
MAEAAKSWVSARGLLPPSLAQRIGSDVLESAYFEYLVNVWGGGSSMTDVMAFIPGSLIAVEAKARETFDDEVRTWIDKRALQNPRSPPHRLSVIDRYSRAFGIDRNALLNLRYQLLQRTLAAALVAKQFGRKRAWMLVQSFVPRSCEEHARNRADFDRYVALVGQIPVLEGIPVQLGWVDEGA